MTNISSPLILDITTEYSNTDISTAYSNVSGEEDGASKSSGFVGMIILMFILALLLNSVAIFSLIRSSTYHHWNSFYRLLLCLTLTDTLGSITSFPVLLVTYAHNLDWQGGQPVCDYVGFMISFSFLSSAAFVGAMSLERFLGVWAPLLFNDKTTRENRTSALIVVIWSFVFILALCPIVGFGEYVIQYPGSWCFYNFRATGANKIYSLVYSVIWLLVITCTVLCNSLVIVKLVQRFVIQRRRATHGNRKIGRSTRNELFSVILLFVIVVVTVTCGIPLAIRAIANENGSEKNNSSDLHASRMATFNMILDPLVYILFRRENLERLFRCCTKPKRNIESETGSSSDKRQQTSSSNDV